MVSGLEVKDSSLILYLRDPFYAEWANMLENRTGISNVLNTYFFFREISALRSLQMQRSRKIR